MPSRAEVFARTVIALEPYAGEIVLIGGWVHALYLASANARERPVATDDIDVTIPHRLLAGNRPMLLELMQEAGFTVQEVGGDTGLYEIFQPGPGVAEIDLDIFTEAAHAREVVWIEGQHRLAAQGYPDQRILLDNTQWLEVGPDIHPLLNPPRRIRVPTLSAYVLVKGLSSVTRRKQTKQVKDLVYLLEIVRHPDPGREAMVGLPDLASRYPEEYRAWREYLRRVLTDQRLLDEIATQLLEEGRSVGTRAEVRNAVIARLRRLLGEMPEVNG